MRSGTLPRLLESTAACLWLIDSAGEIVYLSPAMRLWLGIETDLPARVADSLILDRAALRTGDAFRGHVTQRLHVPLEIAGDGDRNSAAEPRTAVAHFVVLENLSAAQGTGDSPPAGPPGMILGCLGNYLADTEIPWQDWFGVQGVRQSAKLDEELARFRGRQKRHANLLLAGTSRPSRRLRGRVELACNIRSHIGLIGPPGCGAAEIAAMIHHDSAPGEPLVILDASLMDAELLEVYAAPVIAELREQAETTGTLCLDHLDEMPVDAQTRLSEWLAAWPQRLRLIGIRRDTAHRGDTSVPLEESLADAMEVFPIEFPPLAARQDDLELIASGLARSTRISREAIDWLRSYPWPGEWDELTGAIQFAVEIVAGDRIGREHLPLAIRSYRRPQSSGSHVSSSDGVITVGPRPVSPHDFQIDSLDDVLSQYESKLIERAMIAADGNKAEAARRLGISRSRLLRKLSDGGVG
ncbi:helix-turn-helix domain-containing protein [Allorhodopirellula solitaria]|uniref:Regulatory protein LuxO n=1 Tax=Allorhodopirellula solitaria TaxID=2527987 RepID=A0A5C5X0P5_9BACT|nr:helix-turn-helix domain-containing protein [Allorhodopirellula solitaria]TWT56380.1 Regulatory protein LuxO [Allorhodopirellula solitaria]